MSFDAESATPFFPQSYQASRERLLANARAWSRHLPVLIDSRSVPARGPSGETLAQDWVQIGPRRGGRKARRMLILASGTHGLEGFCGAGIQHAMMEHWMRHGAPARPGNASGVNPWPWGLPPASDWPDDFALVILHAVNPYGFAWLRRVNESNVDLNRNSLTRFDTSLVHPDYEALYDLINPTDLDPAREEQRWQAIAQFVAERGERALQQAVSEGQYKYPAGMQFGGQKLEASIVNLHSLVREHLAGVEQAFWIDYHTGLGEMGACELITGIPKASPAFARGYQVWGDAIKSTDSGDSLSAKLHGLMEQGVYACVAPDARFFMVAAEYGTHPVMRVLKAMRMDNWLHHHADSQHPMWPAIKAEVLEAFRPNQPQWRLKVLQGAQSHLGAVFRDLGMAVPG